MKLQFFEVKKTKFWKQVISLKTLLVMSECSLPSVVFPCTAIFILSFVKSFFLIWCFYASTWGSHRTSFFIVPVVCSGCQQFTRECIDHSVLQDNDNRLLLKQGQTILNQNKKQEKFKSIYMDKQEVFMGVLGMHSKKFGLWVSSAPSLGSGQ